MKKYNRLTAEDVKEIKFMAENGMSSREIAYVFDISHVAVLDVLNKPRQRNKQTNINTRKLFGGNGLVGTGNFVKHISHDDDEFSVIESQELPDSYDPTFEAATLEEFVEHIVKGEDDEIS